MLTIHKNTRRLAGIAVPLIKKNGLALLVSVLAVICLVKLFDTLQPIGDHSAAAQKENTFVPCMFLLFYYILFSLLVLSAVHKRKDTGRFSKTLYCMDKQSIHCVNLWSTATECRSNRSRETSSVSA
jgi:hypothetical protein